MRPVHLAGSGLASALGADLAQALRTLRAGGARPVQVDLGEGIAAPYFAIEGGATDWFERARELVCAVAAQAGAAQARDGALFVASTSLDMGVREHGISRVADMQAFSELVGSWLDWRGPIYTVCTACTSAINALLSASALIGAGECDAALVLGLELRNRFTIAGFQGMQLLSPRAAEPLGAARSGLVLGEAVAALRLSAQAARWRLRGGANQVNSSDPAGAVAATVADVCRLALRRSGQHASQIDLVKMQAAGSEVNDATELAGLRQVFAPLPALVSSKGWLGHTLGAAGAAEIALLTACIEADLWPAPPYDMDPGLDATLATQAPPRLRHVLACILGFGGGHAAVVLEDQG
jgi:3-oxoacyl-[acyl-carrier-protein] synthase-1